MDYYISSNCLTVTISSAGAELQSIKSSDGTEYLWNGDEKYWKKHAPNLFPYIGRFTSGKYTYKVKEYQMPRHGFIIGTEMSVSQSSDTSITFSYADCEQTHAMYPFKFNYSVKYDLCDDELSISYIVDNTDDKTIYFGVGGHPAFNVPLEKGKSFEDYYIKFEDGAAPILIRLSASGLVDGEESYRLFDNRIYLRHGLFDYDAIIFKNSGHGVRLCSRGKKSISVSYPDMPYVGFWHMPKTDAPFLCVEPWSSLPSREGIVEDLETQPSLVHLEPSKHYENTWTIKIS
ncbi:MAG: aldose 1-epimerase family protein [Oscillospiraceae bacterium]